MRISSEAHTLADEHLNASHSTIARLDAIFERANGSVMAQQRTKQVVSPSGGKRRRKVRQSKTSTKSKRVKLRPKKIVKVLAMRRVKSPRQIDAALIPVAQSPAVQELDGARLARISNLAETVFGDREKALRWLGNPKRALNGNTPLSCLTDETGEQTVQDLLYQIDYGVYS